MPRCVRNFIFLFIFTWSEYSFIFQVKSILRRWQKHWQSVQQHQFKMTFYIFYTFALNWCILLSFYFHKYWFKIELYNYPSSSDYFKQTNFKKLEMTQPDKPAAQHTIACIINCWDSSFVSILDEYNPKRRNWEENLRSYCFQFVEQNWEGSHKDGDERMSTILYPSYLLSTLTTKILKSKKKIELSMWIFSSLKFIVRFHISSRKLLNLVSCMFLVLWNLKIVTGVKVSLLQLFLCNITNIVGSSCGQSGVGSGLPGWF